MLKNKNVTPILAVKNLDRAKRFYEHTLELEVSPISEPGMFACKSGDSSFLVYTSDFAGTNKANALVWDVGEELESIVGRLRSKDVVFEHYKGLPNTTIRGDIHLSGEMKLAWFKDPDGNILHLHGR